MAASRSENDYSVVFKSANEELLKQAFAKQNAFTFWLLRECSTQGMLTLEYINKKGMKKDRLGLVLDIPGMEPGWHLCNRENEKDRILRQASKPTLEDYEKSSLSLAARIQHIFYSYDEYKCCKILTPTKEQSSNNKNFASYGQAFKEKVQDLVGNVLFEAEVIRAAQAEELNMYGVNPPVDNKSAVITGSAHSDSQENKESGAPRPRGR